MSSKKRSDVPKELTWAVENMFATDAAWEKEVEEITALVPEVAKYKGTFVENSKNLLEFCKKFDEVEKRLHTAFVFANLKSSEDNGNTTYQAMSDKAGTLMRTVYAAVSFYEPELLSLGEEKINKYLEECEELRLYTHNFEDTLRKAKHILSPEMEEVLTKVGEISQGPGNIYSMINDVDIKFGTIIDENGNEAEVTHASAYAFALSKNRNVRRDAFKARGKAYVAQKNTLAATYASSVKGDCFFAKMKNYDSALAAALSEANIPVDVYHNLIKAVHNNLPSLHKYVDVRKRALGLEDIRNYDLAVPMVENVDTKVSYEKAMETVVEGVRILGDEYANMVKHGFENRWVDVYENEGKTSGAFAWGSYGGPHPFVLMNFNDTVSDMFTLAHEMGHAMHSYYTWKTQPKVYGSYPIFLAEVASTVNECLLMDYLLKTTEDADMKKYLINYYMDQFIGTLFRQTQFAEFEMITHEMQERGETLTVDSLNKVYTELWVKYHGTDIIMEEEVSQEWSRIPHFYRAFYVYQYATGYSAAVAFAKRIIDGVPNAVEDYLGFLKAGNSDYAINILKKAGVDMSSPAPVDSALEVFKGLVDQFESYLK
ncbi:MAG: oligoendopeptidase F [Defluviitaleaceae bacterium]|nr:oligoendopeptidase F [Defluviitaleaceae bacterium]